MGRPKKVVRKNNKKKKKEPQDSEVEYLGVVDKQPLEKTNLEKQSQIEEDLPVQENEKDQDKDQEQHIENEEDQEKDQEQHIENEEDQEKDLQEEEEHNDDTLDEAEGDIEIHQEHEHPEQPKRKKQRGPTRMKNIARDPNNREKVEFTDMGEAIGPGSVKLSSYLGPLVREHVPVTIDDWRKISEEVKTVLWKSVQVIFSFTFPFVDITLISY